MEARTTKCAEVMDDLSAIVDGDAEILSRHAEHLGDCDACRDARHEAAATVALVADAGGDYQPPADLEARLLAAIDATGASEAPSKPAASDASEVGRTPPAKEARPEPARPATASAVKRREPESQARPQRLRLIIGAGTLAAAAAIGTIVAVATGVFESAVQGPGPGVSGPPSARITRTVRAATDGSSGIEVRAPGATAFSPVAPGAAIAAGGAIRTDARTRAQIDLSDGTVLVLDHQTELQLDGSTPRLVHLASGEIVADVAHVAGAPSAVFATPTGRVEVLGTKFSLSASPELASVRVTRGMVRAHGAAGGSAGVAAGQEGLLPKGARVRVVPAVDLAASVGWSELGITGETAEASHAGLGELRARRPGERQDRERPLRLSNHRVTVRIVGNMARTEIEETFANDGDQTLEGIYRFPLPPEGRIARLALDVNGRMEEGAFVERDRAAKIWGGVIRHATPVAIRKPDEEFIWVPGPWRDPALLEWQRGGRFELKIFPIPARGQRRVILGYTENLSPYRDGRRYVYPLPLSADASTRVGRFEVDMRVAGADPEFPVVSHGYDMRSSRDGGATRLAFAQDGFLPAGDMIVDFVPPNRNAELRSWTYVGTAAPVAVGARQPARGADAAVEAAARELASDSRPFVAFALRPELPGFTETRPRDYVIVVDASQSMVGERFTRASRLAGSIVGEMDRRDRFVVVACDATCTAMGDAPRSPSPVAAGEVAGWLGTVRPAGASDVVGALERATRAMEGKRASGRDVRVLYLGDGIATVGHRTAASISAEVEALSRSANVAFTTVGIGGDSDALALAAIARSGGGHYVPYVPGERVTQAALTVLETTYGVSLVNPVLEMPAGIVDVSPAKLPTIRAGEEVIVVGRLTGEVRGEVVLRGTVAGNAYLDRYPVALQPSSAEGNSFVPQLWAAKTIERLELDGRGEDRGKIIALSKSFGVLSRHTSLLVLESEAMFRAFGVERAHPTVQWSGESDTVSEDSTGLEAQAAARESGVLGLMGNTSGGGGGRMGGYAGPRMSRSRDQARGDMDQPLGGVEGERWSAADRAAPEEAPAPPMAQAGPRPNTEATSSRAAPRPEMPARRPAVIEQNSVRDLGAAPRPEMPAKRPAGPGRWMRRVWFRTGQVQAGVAVSGAESRAVMAADAALRQQPESRDRHRELLKALSRAGEIDRAHEIAEKWLSRDPLDTEALTSLSDVLGRQGRRDEAMRFLTGVVDLEPDNKALQERLAKAFERAGELDRACAHRIALAEIGNDAESVGSAIRCERARAKFDAASRLLAALPDESARQRAEAAASIPAERAPAGGDITLDASWNGGSDVDLSLVTPQGTRLSWMGGRPTVSAEGARESGRERLVLRRAQVGSYVVEVSRANPDTAPISGRVTVQVLGSRRTLDFVLTGERAAIGRATVRRESRLEPAWR
ncbi:MAG: FecR domain-containing protein [Deltaproteobacteria bacterium]|nr:FecR domain-containing protein [Deltaproteobacteria bacterium]